VRDGEAEESKEGQMRPKTIIYFERIIFGTLLLKVLQSYLSWDQDIAIAAAVYPNSAVAFNLIVQILTIVLFATLTLLVSRRHSKIAMWVSIVLFALNLVSGLALGITLWSQIGMQSPKTIDIIPLAVPIGQVVAVGLLFTPSARRWMRREDEKVREAA
jgi:hypothetical protein